MAAGTVARAFLQQALGVEIVSHVISIGASKPYDGPPPQAADLTAIDASPVRAFDAASEALIRAATTSGDASCRRRIEMKVELSTKMTTVLRSA